MTTFHKYLSQLNTTDSQWGLYVNPRNFDDYRIGQEQFENGGLLDDKVYVGSLESMSYGYQSESEALFISDRLPEIIAESQEEVYA